MGTAAGVDILEERKLPCASRTRRRWQRGSNSGSGRGEVTVEVVEGKKQWKW